MIQLSSNSTLFLKIFLPIFWLTFFGAFWAVSMFVVEDSHFLGFPILNFRIGMSLFWLSGFALFYFTVLRFKRVDADNEFIYISNYFQNARYPYHNIEKIEVTDGGFLDFGYITLRSAGIFGKKMIFVRSTKGFKQYVERYPDVKELIVE